ncbi:MAG: dihydroxyacetone kinase subunit L [Eubacteriaceae bacterium]|nr:dihydroxyacetone kinase subunit L [Eubacteriaceae bacterium]
MNDNIIGREDIKRMLSSISKVMNDEKDHLTELDSAMGDGDLGISMSKGFQILCDQFDTVEADDLGKLLMKLGMLLNANVPSTMGTLISICFIKAAKIGKGKKELNQEDLALMGQAAVDGVMERGKAKVGDKTMLDALVPAVDALSKAVAEGLALKETFKLAYEKAAEGVETSKKLKAVFGRAAYYGDKSVGSQDSGATAIALIFRGISEAELV